MRNGWRNADPSTFVDNWHLHAISEHLEAVTRGEIRRLIINIPPRHSKSLQVAVFWPAWSWLHRPDTRFLFASYAQSLSMRDSVKCRRLIESPWYKENWGDRFRLTSDQNTKLRFDNNHGGYRLATSVDGTATGEGGDIIVIDDPHNVKEAESVAIRTSTINWWNETMSTRLNDPKTGAYVIVMQRVHEEDLVGHILEKEQPDWTHLCLPARYESDHPTPTRTPLDSIDPRTEDGEPLWKERYGDDELKVLERALGSYGTAGQLQQRPAPRDGGQFKRHWFEIVDAAPAEAQRVRYWDKAGTPGGGDYSAGCLMCRGIDGIFYIENVTRGQWSSSHRNATIKQIAALDRQRYPTTQPIIWFEVEGGSGGKESGEISVRDLAGYPVYTEHPTGSKEVRAQGLEAQAEAGNVRLVRGDWNEEFLEEIANFPRGKHDDQVDAAVGAFNKLTLEGSTANVFTR